MVGKKVLLTECLCSSLFPDVVNCMQTDNLELKKLVYLYLMNYAKSQPDMAIMAVNSFVKASSPCRRALALDAVCTVSTWLGRGLFFLPSVFYQIQLHAEKNTGQGFSPQCVSI